MKILKNFFSDFFFYKSTKNEEKIEKKNPIFFIENAQFL